MSETRKKGLIIGLIACLALAVIIPKILLLVFGGKDSLRVISILIGISIVAVFIGIYYSLGGLLKALTVGPVAPTTLMRQLYEVVVKDIFKKRSGTSKNTLPSNNHHPRVRNRPHSNSKRR